VSLPELTLVRFLVLDDDYISDDFIGQYTIPFDCLQTGTYSSATVCGTSLPGLHADCSGYRHITLLDMDGSPIENATLFVHVAVTNKRGGGKPRKRGVSVRRRNFKTQTGIKQVGIKQLDDVFKVGAFRRSIRLLALEPLGNDRVLVEIDPTRESSSPIFKKELNET